MNLLTSSAFIALFAIGVTASGKSTNATVNQLSVRPAVEKTKTAQLTQQQVDGMVDRVYQIRAMDLKALSSEQKQALRKELLTINEQLNHPTGGVYISVGALILIILLLIILF